MATIKIFENPSGINMPDELGTEINTYLATLAAGTSIEVVDLHDDVMIFSGDGVTGTSKGITRTEVNDVAYAVLDADVLIAYTAITADRIVSLPAAATAGEGRQLIIIDEADAAGTYNIVVTPDGTEEINGVNAAVNIAVDYGYIELYCDGANWFIRANKLLANGTDLVRTEVDDVAYAVVDTAAIVAYIALTAERVVTLPAAAAAIEGRTIMIVDEAGAAGTYNLVVTPAGADEINGVNAVVDIAVDYGYIALYCDGADWTILSSNLVSDGSVIERTAVNDVAYAVLPTDVLVAYTAISAARIVTLPAVATVEIGHRLRVADEAGAATTWDITVTPNGTEEIEGGGAGVGVAIAVDYGFIDLYCTGTEWKTLGYRIA